MDRLTRTYVKDFLRPNFFANTPDILTKQLQEGGPGVFKQRYALAATLSPCCGIYSTFELCENKALGGENYADSEKYVQRVWDWNREGNIKDFIARVNKARHENPALQLLDSLAFASSTDENVLAYVKATPDGSNAVLAVVNLDPAAARPTRVTVPLERIGLGDVYRAVDLLGGRTFVWKGREINVFIDPKDAVQLYRLEPLDAPAPEPQGVSELAQRHFAPFAELQYRAAHASDLLARREMKKLFNDEMAWRVYYGPNHDADYLATLDRLARAKGFDSIIEMFVGTPGH
jgi:hypothetical protein